MEKKFKSVVEEFYAKGEDFLIKALEYGENKKNIDRDEDFNLAVQKPENSKLTATGDIIGRTARDIYISKIEELLKKANLKIKDLFYLALLPKSWSDLTLGKQDFLDREILFAIVLEVYNCLNNPDPSEFVNDLNKLLFIQVSRFAPETLALDRIVDKHIKVGIFDYDEINEFIKDENIIIQDLNRKIGWKKFKPVPLLGHQPGKPQPGKKRKTGKPKP